MPRSFPPHSLADWSATCPGAQKHTTLDHRVCKNKRLLPLPIGANPRSVIVRARHVVAADVADQLAAPRLQPLRTDRAKSRNVLVSCDAGGKTSGRGIRGWLHGALGRYGCGAGPLSFAWQSQRKPRTKIGCADALHSRFHGGTVYSTTLSNQGSALPVAGAPPARITWQNRSLLAGFFAPRRNLVTYSGLL